MTSETPPPGDPAWEDVRARYEKGEERVAAIARDIGMTRIALSLKALREGWNLRGKRIPAGKAKADVPSRKSDTTRETIQRLKDMLRARLTQLEQDLRELGSEVNELSTERGIKSVNTLVRTLDKVLELERNDKQKRKKARDEHKYFDDEQRRQLAAKIERLEAERDRDLAVAGAGDGGSDGTEQPVAVLGEAGPAASTGGT